MPLEASLDPDAKEGCVPSFVFFGAPRPYRTVHGLGDLYDIVPETSRPLSSSTFDLSYKDLWCSRLQWLIRSRVRIGPLLVQGMSKGLRRNRGAEGSAFGIRPRETESHDDRRRRQCLDAHAPR